MIKKIIQMVVVIFLTIPLMTHAQKAVTIVNNLEQSPGAVSFGINMSGFPINSNVGSVYLQFEYDINLLEYIDYSPTTLNVSISPNYLGNSIFALSWSSGNPLGVPANGTFITLNFTYRGGFSDTLEFIKSQCEIADASGVTFTEIDYVKGIITPTSAPPAGTATLGSVEAIAGADVAVPLTITDGGSFDDVKSMTFRIGYDTEKLVYKSISDYPAGFSAGESDGVITLVYSGIAPLVLPVTELLNLNFNYLGGGVAAVDFLSGSHVTDFAGTILVTEFENGQVDVDVPLGSGTLTIGKVSSPGATYVLGPNLGDTAWFLAQVPVPIIANNISTLAGSIVLKIAFDNTRLTYADFTANQFIGWTVSSNQLTGMLTFTNSSASGLTIADGALLTLNFNYLNGVANITFEPGTILTQPDATPIPVGLVDGYVTQFIATNIKVYLEGPWNGTDMNTVLPTLLDFPKTQPYSGLPWGYAGLEQVLIVPADVVDWVLVELRDKNDNAVVVGTRAGFLLKGGEVVDLDGISPLEFTNGLAADNYYIAIRHRNHLDIMSANAQPLDASSTLYDFTTGYGQVYGGINGYKVFLGAFVMAAGDIDGNGNIFVNDRTQISPNLGQTAKYLKTDVTFDGNTFVDDRTKVGQNLGKTNPLP